MKPCLFSNQVQTVLFVTWIGLVVGLEGLNAASAPSWMQGGHAARITGLACSPDGAMLASSSEDGTVKLWSTNGMLLRSFNTQPNPATAIAWSPDGNKIAAGTYSGGVLSGKPGLGLTYLWKTTGGWTTNASLVRVTTNRFGKVTALAFSADNSRLVSGSAAGSNIVNSVADGSIINARPAYITSVRPAAVTSVAYSSPGLLASGCEDGMMSVYDAAGNLVWWSNNASTSNVTAVAFSPDGSWLATASLDHNISIWSTASWTIERTLTGHTNGVTSVGFSPDGQRIVSGSVDGTIRIWNRVNGDCLNSIFAHALPVTASAFSPDGTRVISAGDDQTIRMWAAVDGEPLLALGGQRGFVGAVAFSPDGNLCASAGGDSTIQVRHSSDGASLCALPGHMGGVTGIAFSPDSTVLASTGGPLEPTIKLWRLSDGAVLRTINASTNGVTALAFSPDGSLLASGGDFTEQSIRLWNVSDGTLRQTLVGHSHGVTALAFSPDSKLIASGGRRFDNTVKIWAVTNGALIGSWAGHAWNIEAIAFAPDGNSVASASRGTNPLSMLRLSDGSRRFFGASTNPVFAIAFSPDSTVLASGETNAVQLWNVSAGTLSETVNVETIRPTSIAYSPNGNLFLCGREDGTVTMSVNSRGALGQPPLTFTDLALEADGTTTLRASVQPWTHYVLWSSPNLIDWSFVTLGVSSTNGLTIADPFTRSLPTQFYRATTPR